VRPRTKDRPKARTKDSYAANERGFLEVDGDRRTYLPVRIVDRARILPDYRESSQASIPGHAAAPPKNSSPES
jgi:hypothetical protein